MTPDQSNPKEESQSKDVASASPVKDPAPEDIQGELIRKLEPYTPNRQKAEAAAQQVMSVVMTEIQMHSGPLPPAREYGQYEVVLPGAAERILAMAEREQNFRHEQARTAIGANVKFAARGQWMGLVVSGGFIAGGVACAFLSAPAIGVAMVGAGAVGIVGAFLQQGRQSGQRKSLPAPEAPKPPAKKGGKRR